MTKVYVAGASSEREHRAKPMIAALRAAGYTITHDWTTAVDMHGANGDSTLDENQLAECADADYQGVRSADIFVLLAPYNMSTGAWVELGVALACCKHIAIAGNCSQCIFTLIRGARFDSDEELLAGLQRRPR